MLAKKVAYSSHNAEVISVETLPYFFKTYFLFYKLNIGWASQPYHIRMSQSTKGHAQV